MISLRIVVLAACCFGIALGAPTYTADQLKQVKDILATDAKLKMSDLKTFDILKGDGLDKTEVMNLVNDLLPGLDITNVETVVEFIHTIDHADSVGTDSEDNAQEDQRNRIDTDAEAGAFGDIIEEAIKQGKNAQECVNPVWYKTLAVCPTYHDGPALKPLLEALAAGNPVTGDQLKALDKNKSGGLCATEVLHLLNDLLHGLDLQDNAANRKLVLDMIHVIDKVDGRAEGDKIDEVDTKEELDALAAIVSAAGKANKSATDTVVATFYTPFCPEKTS